MDWLLRGDASIRYQTLRDLADADENEIRSERNKILTSGWGKALIDLQDDDGTWTQTLYSPKWISTFYSLLLLKRFGAEKTVQTEKTCFVLLDKGFYEPDGGINYWKSWKTGECCVTAMLLSMLCHFQIEDDRIPLMVGYILREQMADGGWNCERPRGATHSSFHTTISVLEGLWDFETNHGESDLIEEVRRKQKEGVEFLLKHQLYKSSTTGEIVDSRLLKATFPQRWYFDYLRCLDYFQRAGAAKDERMSEAIELLKGKQTEEGFWKLEGKHRNKVYFEMEKLGKESRWITLMALRVMKWWESSPPLSGDISKP